MKSPYLSVVIPAYNEEENFNKGVLNNITKYLNKQKFFWEVILVDDGSTDQTLKLLKNFIKTHSNFLVFKTKHGGKLKAIEAGIENTKGKIVLFTDFDQSTPIYEFDKFLPHLNTNADIVIGSRMSRQSVRINDPVFRYFRSKILNFFIKLLLIRGIDDTQCGFKAFKLNVAKKLFKKLKVTRMTKPKGGFMGPFDIEILFLAKKLNYKIVSVPVTWQYFSSKRLSVISEPVKFLIDIFKIKLFDISGRYIRGAPC